MKTFGTYRFSPPLSRKGKTTRRDGKTTKWWLILECSPDLGRFYRQLYQQHHYHIKSLQSPLWGAHISVIRDEKPVNLEHWKSLDGQKTQIEYSQELQEIHSYAFLPVSCDTALDYRELLGLPRTPKFPLHLTIGNLKNS